MNNIDHLKTTKKVFQIKVILCFRAVGTNTPLYQNRQQLLRVIKKLTTDTTGGGGGVQKIVRPAPIAPLISLFYYS